MSELKPCREAFEEWYQSIILNHETKHDVAELAWETAWNRRSGGEHDIAVLQLGRMALDYFRLEQQHAALLDAVREVRDGLREASKIDYNSRQVREEMAETADDLTRIIDEHKEAE